jgi:arylsulfatase A-like enzyme
MDTLSARHMSLYGYPRATTPQIARFAESSNVYHAHHTGGNFTSPGTASMLMGMYPWTHRALTSGSFVKRDLVKQNIFRVIGESYYRVGYAQTFWADTLLGQFSQDIDRKLHPASFSISGPRVSFPERSKTREFNWHILDDFLAGLSPNLPASLLGGYLSTLYYLRDGASYIHGYPDYPNGIPSMDNFNIAYKNEDVYQGVYDEISAMHRQDRPYFGYFHLYSPHEDYKPRKPFSEMFSLDDFIPVEKPSHPLSSDLSEQDLLEKRLWYDRYIANVDDEFGKLMDMLEKDGILDTSYIILTSDHGQLMERGLHGHGGALMFEGVMHIPLIIHAPGQNHRQDIYSTTNNADLLPTLASLTSSSIPENVDGSILPGLGGEENSERPSFSVAAFRNSTFMPLNEATVVMYKGKYKLIYYKGYKLRKKNKVVSLNDFYELYNLQDDPDEMKNLFSKNSGRSTELKNELLAALDTADRIFRRD